MRHEHLDGLIAARRACGLGHERGLLDREQRSRHGAHVEDAVVGGIAEAAGRNLVADLEALVEEASGRASDGVRRATHREHAVLAQLRLDNRSRILRERPNQRFVDEVRWRGERNARRAVVADIAVAKRGAPRVTVGACRRISDIGLGQYVAQRVRQFSLAFRDRCDDVADGRENAFGEVVHQGVRPVVSRRMGEEAVRPSENLRLLLGAEPRIALRRPRHVGDARDPGRIVSRVDDSLSHDNVRESVRADAAGEIELRISLQGLHDLRMDRVLLALDRHLAVGENIGEDVVGNFDVGIRLPRDFGERINCGANGARVLEAKQVTELMRRVTAKHRAVLGSIAAIARNVFAEHESDIAMVAISGIDFLG